MGKEYEVEIRAKVDESFKQNLIVKGAQIGENDPYQDDYFKPINQDWDPEIITMRVRKSDGKDWVEVLFSKVSYVEKQGLRIKRSLFPQGKVKIFSGSEQKALELLKELGFEYWFTVKKPYCAICKFEDTEFALENIDDFGWTIEIEGDGSEPENAIADLWKKLKKLGIQENQLMFKSMPKLVAENKGLV